MYMYIAHIFILNEIAESTSTVLYCAVSSLYIRNNSSAWEYCKMAFQQENEHMDKKVLSSSRKYTY